METALTEGAEQRRLAYARVADQDDFEQTVRGKQRAFVWLLETIKQEMVHLSG